MRILHRIALPFAFTATAGLFYFGTAYRMARELEKREAKVDAAYARIAALGDAAGADMARSLPDDLPVIADACRGKLGATMTAASIVTYVAEAPSDVKASLAALLATHPKPYDLPHVQVLPTKRVGGSVDARQPFLASEPATVLVDPRPRGIAAVKALLHDDLSPLAWTSDVAIEARRGPDVLGARFVAVALVRAAAPPTLVEDRAYQGGVGVLQVRVVDIETGATACEGKQVVHMPAEVSGAPLGEGGASDPSRLASAFDDAIVFGALHGLCEAGGDALCAETARKVR